MPGVCKSLESPLAMKWDQVFTKLSTWSLEYYNDDDQHWDFWVNKTFVETCLWCAVQTWQWRGFGLPHLSPSSQTQTKASKKKDKLYSLQEKTSYSQRQVWKLIYWMAWRLFLFPISPNIPDKPLDRIKLKNWLLFFFPGRVFAVVDFGVFCLFCFYICSEMLIRISCLSSSEVTLRRHHGTRVSPQCSEDIPFLNCCLCTGKSVILFHFK